ncbi:MAG TPA: chemotaxis protein CheA [Spirochaetota bacterium]|nr:chemotaxis protein CheA [Spirochaetota bacterium]HOS41193.1 chemotaxis protein CheA [Spirochaetota bacterium]HPI22166.1 chemotaxis protein CheA [Spirochaetota bacterium]
MIDATVREVFIQEAQEILKKLESDVVRLEERFDHDILHDVFRSFHTLKGSSGIVGMTDLSEFTHHLENMMASVRDGKTDPGRGMIDIILNSIDWIKLYLFGDSGAEALSDIRGKLERAIAEYGVAGPSEKGAPAAEAPAEDGVLYRYFKVAARFPHNVFEKGIDPLMIIEDLCALGTVVERAVNRDALPEFGAMDPEKCYLSWEVLLKTEKTRKDVDDVFLFVSEESEIAVADVTAECITLDGGALSRERRLGEIMVNKGIITDGQLLDAVHEQEERNVRLGDLVVQKGYATPDDVRIALTEQEKLKTRIETDTVRVDTAKLDRVMNLLGEIVIGQAAITRVADLLSEQHSYQLKSALYGLDRTTRELQEQIMSIRMIPIGPTFDQFRRFVRDTAHALGKEIVLEMSGEDTELDKTVIEKIGDPLKHMIRNAIDHGIEPAAERELAGKPRAGRIRLRAYHQEGNVFIEVVDDGRGLDYPRMREKAIMMGLVRADEEVGESRLASFLFLPGFSTAKSVGDLSGRGVGMDVVKTNIDALRGVVTVESRKNAGCTVRVKLPLTLAIIEGMLVRVGAQVYIIPLLSIVESLRPRVEDVKTVEGAGEVISVRGEYIAMVRMDRFFGIEADIANPWEALVVIVEASGSKIGLMVDDLLGQHQVVIKSMDGGVTASRAISGASILGDGKVALIIDTHGLAGELAS